MSELFSTAFTLLLIGMITVFVVLFLVYLSGNILIVFVNRFFPVEPENRVKGEISNPTLAAITATVDVITKGKGQITKIEKEN